MLPMMFSSIRKLHTAGLCLRPVIDEKLIIWKDGSTQIKTSVCAIFLIAEIEIAMTEMIKLGNLDQDWQLGSLFEKESQDLKQVK